MLIRLVGDDEFLYVESFKTLNEEMYGLYKIAYALYSFKKKDDIDVEQLRMLLSDLWRLLWHVDKLLNGIIVAELSEQLKSKDVEVLRYPDQGKTGKFIICKDIK